MELILVRHGLPERTDTTADPPLTAEGHEQARKVAQWLAPDGVDAVVSSTMLRAVQTAQPFTELTGHALTQHDGIAEFDRGSGVYTPMEVLKREDYAAWKAFAEGGHVEDIDAFQTLVVDALAQAQVVLEAIDDAREKVVVAGNSVGQVTEFQLRERFIFRLRSVGGRELIPRTELLQNRDLSYTESAALSKELEENFLYRTMQTDIVSQVMRRLASIRTF